MKFINMKKIEVGDEFNYMQENLLNNCIKYTITGIEEDEIYFKKTISNSYDMPIYSIGNMPLKNFKAILYAAGWKTKDE